MSEKKAHQQLMPETSVTDASQTRPALRVLVLGGTGFIGRHAAAALNASGAEVVIGSRHPLRHAHAYPYASFRPARFEDLTAPHAWTSLLGGIDVVVRSSNLAGRKLAYG